LNEKRLAQLGITQRELDILELIANGLSNREIAEKLFISENAVKTHSSRLSDKLSAGSEPRPCSWEKSWD
jgi:ATP/maltotriose-dependent transcriptional regulator MalT